MERFTVHLLFFLFACCLCALCPAQSSSKIIRVSYTSSPVSQYRFSEEDMQSTPTKVSRYEFWNGITDYYSLYINLGDRGSLYTLDSTVRVKSVGWDGWRPSILDTVYFTLKSADNRTYKHEWIMSRTFFSEGRVGDIKWELLDEKRTINGLSCLKAVSTNYPMLTAWYTKDVPVSNGPSIYQGLPGLVVWVEDYYRTIEIRDISYGNDVNAFNERYTEKMAVFKQRQKEKGVDDANEALVLVQKGDLSVRQYERSHEKPYKR